MVWDMVFWIKHEIVSNAVFRLYLEHDMCTINFDYTKENQLKTLKINTQLYYSI
jgi:hypothetical protein